MRFCPFSDIHLELNVGELNFSKMQFNFATDCDLYVAAGDIDRGDKAVKWLSKFKKPVLYVPGNHEFYYNDWRKLHSKIKKMMGYKNVSNIVFLDNSSTVIDGVKFIGSTLWTDCKLTDNDLTPWMLEKGMNDYHLISDGARVINTNDTIEAFNLGIKFIEREVESHDGPCVVITHHSPSSKSIQSEYQDHHLNAAYASNLEGFILRHENIRYWIHGHMHSAARYNIGNCEVVCNAFGYAFRGEGAGFDETLVLEV